MGKTGTQNVTIRLPTALVKEIDAKVDGIKFRTRTHFIIAAITDFIEE